MGLNIVNILLYIVPGIKGRAIAPRMIKKGSNFLFQKNTNTSNEKAKAIQLDLDPVLNRISITGINKAAHINFLNKVFSFKRIEPKKGIVKTINSIKIGDAVRETIQNSDFGKVVEINPAESIFWESSEDGKFVSSSRAGYSSLRITMEVQGIISKTGISIDKSVYYVGQGISLYAGKSILENGRISEVVKAQ